MSKKEDEEEEEKAYYNDNIFLLGIFPFIINF
jgi:hypothetical protein